MEQRDIKIMGNMLALARRGGGKGAKSKRSLMLRTIMPHLSQETGDALADAISKGSTAKFANVWNKVRDEISSKIGHKHAAHAGSEEYDGLEIAVAGVKGSFFQIFGDEFGRMMEQINAQRDAEIAQGRIHPKGSPLYKAEDDPIAHLP